jgi:hypothetical protein
MHIAPYTWMTLSFFGSLRNRLPTSCLLICVALCFHWVRLSLQANRDLNVLRGCSCRNQYFKFGQRLYTAAPLSLGVSLQDMLCCVSQIHDTSASKPRALLHALYGPHGIWDLGRQLWLTGYVTMSACQRFTSCNFSCTQGRHESHQMT